MVKKKCIVLSEKNKKILNEIKNRRIESDARMEVIDLQVKRLKKRVEDTNQSMSFLL